MTEKAIPTTIVEIADVDLQMFQLRLAGKSPAPSRVL